MKDGVFMKDDVINIYINWLLLINEDAVPLMKVLYVIPRMSVTCNYKKSELYKII